MITTALKMTINIPNSVSCMLLKPGRKKDRCFLRKILCNKLARAHSKSPICLLSNMAVINITFPLPKSKQFLSLISPSKPYPKNFNPAKPQNNLINFKPPPLKTKRNCWENSSKIAPRKWNLSAWENNSKFLLFLVGRLIKCFPKWNGPLKNIPIMNLSISRIILKRKRRNWIKLYIKINGWVMSIKNSESRKISPNKISMNKSNKKVERKVKLWMIFSTKKMRLSINSAKVYFRRKDWKSSLNSALKTKPEMKNILPHSTTFYKIWKKWSTLKKITWNLYHNP